MDQIMTKRSSRGGRVPRDRWRLVLSFGIVLGLGSVNTLAAWTDDARLAGTSAAGSIDLLINSQLQGQDGTVTSTGVSAPSMLPGSVAAEVVTVRNGGTAALTFSATAIATGSLAPDLTWVIRQGGALSGSTCAGGTVLLNGAIGATQTAIGTATTLAAGTQQSYCVQVTLNPQLSVVARGRTAATTFTFSAAQA